VHEFSGIAHGDQGEQRGDEKAVGDERQVHFRDADFPAALSPVVDLESGGGQAEGDQEPAQEKGLAGLQGGHAERGKGDELALRNEQYSRHREDKEDGQGEQGIYRAVGHPVLPQQHHDLVVHVNSSFVASFTEEGPELPGDRESGIPG